MQTLAAVVPSGQTGGVGQGSVVQVSVPSGRHSHVLQSKGLGIPVTPGAYRTPFTSHAPARHVPLSQRLENPQLASLVHWHWPALTSSVHFPPVHAARPYPVRETAPFTTL